MIWTIDVKKLLEELKEGDSLLTLDSLTIQAGETFLKGRGKLREEKGRFSLTARFDQDSVPGEFSQAHFSGMEKPRIYSRDEFWKMEAKTSGGILFACEVGPPHRWTDRSDGVTEISCHIDKLTVTPGLLDATDFGFLEKTIEKINEPGAFEEGFTVSLDSPQPVPSKFHAILPGVKCVLAEHFTKIERHNPFLPTTSESKRDTYWRRLI